MQKPFNVKLVTKLWRTFNILKFLKSKSQSTSSWLNLLLCMQIISSIKDDYCFSTLTFMKTKLWNRLTMHLELVIHV
jgi:hypothetical protein